jgi:rod shape-determining protein MreC
MENFFSRYKNPLALMLILFIQVVALATQVKRPEKGAAASGGTRLIRVWTVTAISPFERALVSTGSFVRRNFHNYIDLHNVRQQNRELQDEVAQLKLEQVRLRQDAEQARRLQALLGFTQHYVGQLLPAQVIGTSGSEQSHMIQIDKGYKNGGIKVDMPVITPDGIVGKVKDVYPYTSQVLMISDRESGAGVILQNSRLQGILRGSPTGELHVSDIMADEKIDEGEEVVTSGGDRIYPKGLPVGTVSHVSPDGDNDSFLAIRVKPAADLNRLEEVLVVTRISEAVPKADTANNVRAADILSERLPSVPKADDTKKSAAKPGASPSPSPAAASATATQKPPSIAGVEPRKSPAAAAKPGATTNKTEAKPGTVAGSTATASPGAGSTAGGPPLPKKTPGAAGNPGEKKSGTALPTATKTPSGTRSPDANVPPTPGATPRHISDSPTPTPKKTPGTAASTQKTMAPQGATPSSTPAASATPKPKPSAPPARKPTPAATPTVSATPQQTTKLGSGPGAERSRR